MKVNNDISNFLLVLVCWIVLPSQAAFLHKQSQSLFLINGSSVTSKTHLHLWDVFNEGKKALVKKIAGDYDAPAIRNRIDALVNENPVLMLSFTTCPFCIKAKEVLGTAKYTVVELDKDADGKAIRAELGEMVGRTSVPAIWIGGKFIGGCNDGPTGGVVKLQESGELQKLLKSVGAI